MDLRKTPPSPPSSPAFHSGQVASLLRSGQLQEARLACAAALEADSACLEARLLLAQCHLNLGDLKAAWQLLEAPASTPSRDSSHLRRHHAELWAILSLGLFEAQDFDLASRACEFSIQLDPDNFTALCNQGSIRLAQGRPTEALPLFRRATVVHPREARSRLLLITALNRLNDSAEVAHEINAAIRFFPNDPVVHESVLATHYNLGNWDAYRAEVERFHKGDPSHPLAEYRRAFVDLLFGDMASGWRRYETRLQHPKDAATRRTFSQARWNGERFPGKTLLVWAEQGFGDTFMFLRYLKLVKALGGTVLLEAQPTLAQVAATCDGPDLVVPRGEPLPPFDLQVPLMSLAYLFQTEIPSIPADIPYLDVPQEVPHRWEILDRLTQAQESTKVGLVWAGRPEFGRDFERSLPAEALAPLASLSGVSWFSFQVGRKELPPLPNLTTLAPLLQDFSDTAYALSGMDLVITVDTALAHLAGALGIPTLVLLPFQPDFRWLLNRADSPWYPTLRLYRQPAYGDWGSVMAEVLADLTPEA